MKKKVLAVVLILTMCFIFASCGKDAKESPYVGTWKAINASFAGVAYCAGSFARSRAKFTDDAMIFPF